MKATPLKLNPPFPTFLGKSKSTIWPGAPGVLLDNWQVKNKLSREGTNFSITSPLSGRSHPTRLQAQKVNLCVLFFLPEKLFFAENVFKLIRQIPEIAPRVWKSFKNPRPY